MAGQPPSLLDRCDIAVRGAVDLVTDSFGPAEGGKLLGIHLVGYMVAVFAVMSPLIALAFIVVHQGLFGLYLGCSFAPNHKGMPPLSAADDADFLRRQVLTSHNVRGHWVTDAALGGLNYQIEHHLFPSMPRANLRHAQPIVERFCADIGVRYLETGLVASYAQALRHLDTVGNAARDNEAVSVRRRPSETLVD